MYLGGQYGRPPGYKIGLRGNFHMDIEFTQETPGLPRPARFVCETTLDEHESWAHDDRETQPAKDTEDEKPDYYPTDSASGF